MLENTHNKMLCREHLFVIYSLVRSHTLIKITITCIKVRHKNKCAVGEGEEKEDVVLNGLIC